MNFSDNWRSLWPIGAVPPSPNLLSGHESSSLGPLLFRGAQSSHTILASSSLALRIPPASPPTILADIQSVCRCPATSFLLSSAAQYNLAADIATSLASASDPLDSLSRNNLHALPCSDGSSLLLFFPTGENGDEIGFLCLRFKGENLMPDVGVDLDGEIFKQREGLQHPRHRILKMSVVSTQASSSLPKSNYITEGFLMATTLYSVNWFRVETKVSDRGMVWHSLVPLAKKGFQHLVVDACWSPHFSEESVVLLKSGKLYLFNLINKTVVRINVLIDKGDSGWLGCKFGWQPWVILVASSTTVLLIDLRPDRLNEEPKVLARVKLPDFLGVVSEEEEEKDTFQAFCRADYSNFHFTIVTERLLLLFDMREPLIPVLTWVHGLDHPTYVSMFRLSELRPSEEFKWASESGFVIMVGSFRKNEFKLFCYGSSDRGAFRSCLYAWELPSSLSLSGRQWHSADDLVRELILKEKLPNQELLLRRQVVTGFHIVSNSLLKSRTEPSGFVLIRLTLSGKLEIQEYHAYRDSPSYQPLCEEANMQEVEDFTIYNVHEGGSISNRFLFLKLSCLYTYMKGNLSTMLVNLYSELNHKVGKHKPFCDDLREVLSSKVQSSNISISNFISDASLPTNVFEIALRRLLTTLKPNILSLAFTKYGELFTGRVETSFLPLKFPNRLPHHQFPPFFVNIPSNRSENLSSNVLDEEAIVGPILPLPVLLVLQQMATGSTEFSIKEGLDDELLNLECKGVLENVFPETSTAQSGVFSGCGVSQELLEDKQFLVCQPTLRGSNTTSPNKERTRMNHLSEMCPCSEYSSNDERFTTFICGISVKDCKADLKQEVETFDFNPLKLDFEPLDLMLQPTEQKIMGSLKRQASNWLENNKSYQDFFTSSKFQKSI